MGIIKGILEEELKRLEELFVFYQDKIAKFPRGSISVKERGGKRYIYLARRQNKKVIFDYEGKDIPDVRNALNGLMQQRKGYESKLRQVKENLHEVRRALREKRT